MSAGPGAVVAFVGLGSNLGDREAALAAAALRLARLDGTRLSALSSVYETAPVGGPPGQPPFLNAVAAVETALSPRRLLDGLLAIERDLGRIRGPERNGPRTIDLDLLLHGDSRLRAGEDLEVPHPRLSSRAFVLVPLAEIAPGAILPGTGGATPEKLLARLDARGVRRLGPFPLSLPAASAPGR